MGDLPFTEDTLALLFRLGPHACWRSDIDLDPQAALPLARLQQQHGIRARYLFRFDGAEYDMAEHRQALAAVRDAGHLLGVHVVVPDGAAASDLDGVIEEQWAPARRLGLHGRLVSFHQPTELVLWRHLPGWHSLFHPRWRGRYSADSGGRFRTDPFELLRQPVCQINLHPEWWYTRAGVAERLEALRL